MVQETKIRRRIASSIANHGLVAILASVLLVLLISILIAYHFQSPGNLIMTTGFESGSYQIFGERYREILARDKVHLELLPSSGSVENLKRLNDKSSRVDAGFVQDGMSSPGEVKDLVSLGAIGYSPLWVFYRSEETFHYLSEFRGKRIAIGPEGSGVRIFATELLKLNNSAAPPTVLLDLAGAPANKALLEGKVDAVMIIGAEDNALVKELLYNPNLKLMTFRQAEAYTRLIPALSHVVLPQGILDISKRTPSQDIHLLAVTTSLIVREDLHPALVYLLLDAAVEIHSNAGWVHKKGEFPSPRELSFPASKYAEKFYKSGRPFMVPVAIILIPLIRSIPWLYSWRQRRKFYHWYRELKNLELEVMENPEPEDMSGYHERIDRIEASINKIPVPLAFFDEAYKLQEHVDLVRRKLGRLSNHPKAGNP